MDKDEVKVEGEHKLLDLETLHNWSKIVDKKQKIHIKDANYAQFNVDNVDNYWLSKLSPTVKISPAPIVINRSPFILFFNKNFSISVKEGK